jgi:hypothetical protein
VHPTPLRAQFTDQSCLAAEPGLVASGGTNGVTAVQLGDLDGDGRVDVVTASVGDDRITWFRNVGTPSAPAFEEQTITASADGASGVYLERLNGDGCLDVLAASSNDDTIAWYEQGCIAGPVGTGTFTEHVITTDANGALGVHAADMNGDGCMDVLAASFNDNTVALFEQDCEVPEGGVTAAPLGTFTERIVTTVAVGAAAVWADELDADPGPEIVVASRLDNSVAGFIRVPGDPRVEDDPPTFERFPIASNALRVTSVVTADLNGDGLVDVVSASPEDDKVAWYRNLGGDPPGFAPQVITTSADGARSVALFDDGTNDWLVVASSVDGTVRLFEVIPAGAGAPPVFVETVVTTNAAGANGAAASDLDGDTDFDVVSASSVSGAPATGDKVAWYANDGQDPPAFTENPISGGSILPEAIVLTDIDGDIDLDVVVASSVDDTIAWYENAPSPPPESGPMFSRRVVTTAADAVVAVAAGDLDGPPGVDLVSALPNQNRIAWYANDGAGSFTEATISNNAGGVASVFVADIDEDGNADVLAASRGDNKVAWYENDGGDPPAFTERSVSFAVGGASAVHAADVDGDGDPDVLAAAGDDREILLFENDPLPDGSPVFTRVVVSTNAAGARAVVAAELADTDPPEPRGDGVPSTPNPREIVAASATSNRVAWFERVRGEAEDVCEVDPGIGATFVAAPFAAYVWAGLDDTVTVSITNDGAVPLTAFSIAGADAEAFTLSTVLLGDPPSIAAGATGAVEVTFAPGAASAYCAELAVSNGTDTARLALAGLGQAWLEHLVTSTAAFARALAVEDVDGDDLPDILVGSSGDDTVSVFLQRREEEEGAPPVISFSERVISDRAEAVRAVAAGDLGGSTPGGEIRIDVVTGSQFQVGWHEGGFVEQCNAFDVNPPASGPGRLNGVELGWIGAGFLQPDDPMVDGEWFEVIDYNGDGLIDGDDLAILAADGVFGQSTQDPDPLAEPPDDLCNFTCISQE